MGYKSELFLQNTGCICEKCGVITDKQHRLVVYDTGGGAVYLCPMCLQDSYKLITVKVNHPQPNWTMTRADLLGWVDPAWRSTGIGPDDLRETMSRYEERFRELCKDFTAYNNGYTDRGKFLLDVRGHYREVLKAVESYLQKTT